MNTRPKGVHMSLRLIYGRSGTGKSSYMYQEIKNRINKENKIYIITPEQFSFTAERKLMDSIGSGSVINVEVLTFGRMAYRVIAETRSELVKLIYQNVGKLCLYLVF